MRIGVDIDGTINNFCEVLVKTLKDEYNFDADDTQYYMMSDLFTAKEEVKFWETHADKMYMECSVRPFALETLQWIYNNDDLYIVTARHINCTNVTKKWLAENHIQYKELYMETGHKHQICEELKLDLLIDDSPMNAISVAEVGIPVLLFDQPYNHSLKEKEPIYRVYNWLEIYTYLKDLIYKEMIDKK